MKLVLFSALIILVSALAVRADQAVEEAQRVLKDQGFYYGEINGVRDSDTGAAIRRYQIRSGLQVDGELNAETIRSLHAARNSTTSSTPQPRDATADEQSATSSRNSAQPDNQTYEQGPMTPPSTAPVVTPSGAGIFAGTPYETAPPPIQRSVVSGAQDILLQRGFYRGSIDGAYGPATEFALRAYQSQANLQPTGVFDMDTLAAMQLLPSQHVPRQLLPRRVYPQPPVRGEWIRE